MRKIFTILVAVLMTTGMWALDLVDGYYQIGTAQDLKDFAALVNAGSNTINGKLTANIDLQGSSSNQWTPIGNSTYPFNGTFDGQGFTVSNLYYHQEVGGVGFFGRAGSSARIKNIRAIVDIDNTGNGATACCGATSAGGILGIGVEGTLVINCSVAGSVISFSNVGGIVGLGQVTVVNSYNEATVKFYNNNGQTGGGIHGFGGPATLINCYNVGNIINTGPEATSHMGNIAVEATTTYCYSHVNSCHNGASADVWCNQAPNGIPGITMVLADMQNISFTNDLYANAMALRGTYSDIDTWMQDPTTGLPILNQSYKPSEGPWTRIGEITGCCEIEYNNASLNPSIAWKYLNNTQWDGTIFPYKDNTNGIGSQIQATTRAYSKQAIYTLYTATQTIPSYSVMVWNWSFRLSGQYTNLAQQIGLYAGIDLNTLESTALDFTYNNESQAGSDICVGLFSHSAGHPGPSFSQESNHNIWLDNRNGSTDLQQPVYMIQTHIIWCKGEASAFGNQWMAFKHLNSSYSYNYYKILTYDANGGEGWMAQQQIENSGNLTANAFTRAHKVFNGWSDGTNSYADEAEVTATADSKGPVTLHAQWIDAPMATLTAPTAISGLEYTGSAQELINAGSASGGELQYKLDNGAWSTSIPTATNVGTYTVYYRVVADDNHSDNPGSSVEVTIGKPTPVIAANEDPQHPDTYYSTFYYGLFKYLIPEGVEAYAATIGESDLFLKKIAGAGDVLPEGTAVILKSTVAGYTMVPTDNAAIVITEPNALLGTDEATAAPANCYVLSGHSSDNSVTGVGFYQYSGTLKAHRAYVVVGSSSAPKRMRFVFDTETGVESIQSSAVSVQKILRDGQLIIIRGDREYNTQGQIIK